MNIAIKDLKNRQKQYNKYFKENGMDAEVETDFAFGMFGYYININYNSPNKHQSQIKTGYGTKKEAYINLELAFYKALRQIEEQ